MDGTREPAKISHVLRSNERGCTFSIACVGRDSSWGQSFGDYNLVDETHCEYALMEICAVFGVAEPALLSGKPCYVLRNWPDYGELIVGLESEETGRRFVIHDFVKRFWPQTQNAKEPLELRRELVRGRVAGLERRLHEARAELAALADGNGFVSWSSR